MKNLETLATSVKYKVIYADPPWYFRSYSSKGEGRNATQHYNCMSISDICKLPIQKLADENCALLMWCVDPMLPEAFKVIEVALKHGVKRIGVAQKGDVGSRFIHLDMDETRASPRVWSY